MDSLLDTVRNAVATDTDRLADAVGADRSSVGTALNAALPLLIGALARHAAESDEAARELAQAVTEDHRGALLDDVADILRVVPDRGAAGGLGSLLQTARSSIGEDGGEARALDGRGILVHVLGTRLPAVEEGIGRMSGLDRQQVRGILELLAPLFMAGLARAQATGDLDGEGLASFLEEQRQSVESQTPAMKPGGLNALVAGEGAPIMKEVSHLERTLDRYFGPQ